MLTLIVKNILYQKRKMLMVLVERYLIYRKEKD